MNGIEKITQRIEADTQQEIDALRAENQAQVNAIRADFQAQADRERDEILQRGNRQAQERLERLESATQMEIRKLQLGAKQEILSEAFDMALEKLCSLPDPEYTALLVKLALQAVKTGKEQLIFSPKDRNRVGKQVVVAVNEALAKQVSPELPDGLGESKVGAFLEKVVNSTSAMLSGTGLLTLSEETRNIRGGFIMADGAVETNCSFETLVALQRGELEREAAAILFQ